MSTAVKEAAIKVPEATTFSLKTPGLTSGRSVNIVAKTDLFSLAVKIYAQGGENGLHAHVYEDHTFVVLHGQATFFLGKEKKETVVGPNEGVLIPRGAFYKFQSSGDENLVMLRIGAETPEKSDVWRIHPDGSSFVADTPERKRLNGYKEPVIDPNKTYFE